jgi:hypothetical protein
VPASVTAGVVANGKKALPPQSASSSGTAAAKQQQQHPSVPAKEATTKKQQQNATAAADEELEREKQQQRRILLVLGFIMCLAVSGAVAVLWSSSSVSAISPTSGAFDAASGDRSGARAGYGGPNRAGDGYGKRGSLRNNGGSYASPSSSRSHNLVQNGGRGPLTPDEPSQSFVATGGSPRFHSSQRTHQRGKQDHQREQTRNQPASATSLLDAFEISKQPPSLLDAAFDDL